MAWLLQPSLAGVIMSRSVKILFLLLLMICARTAFAQAECPSDTYVHKFLELEMDGIKTESEQKEVYEQLDKIVDPIVKDKELIGMISEYNDPSFSKKPSDNKYELVTKILGRIGDLFKTNERVVYRSVDALATALIPEEGTYYFDCDTSSMIYVEVLERLFSKDTLPIVLLDVIPVYPDQDGHMLIRWYYNKPQQGNESLHVDWETTGDISNNFTYYSSNSEWFELSSDFFLASAIWMNSSLLIDQGRFVEALQRVDEAIKLYPHYRFYGARAFIKHKFSDHIGAINDLKEAERITPEYFPLNPYIYLGLSTSKAEIGDYKGALNDIDIAIDAYPYYTDLYNSRGFTKHDMGDYEGAIEDYDKVIELDPTYAYAYNNRGHARFHLEQYSRAMKDFNKSVKLNPNNEYVYINRGELNCFNLDYDAALEDYNKAIELAPQNSDAYQARAFVKEKLGDKEGAAADLRKACELKLKK